MGQNNSKMAKRGKGKDFKKTKGDKSSSFECWAGGNDFSKCSGNHKNKERFSRLRKWFGTGNKNVDVIARQIPKQEEFTAVGKSDDQLSREFRYQPRKLTFRKILASCIPCMMTERDLDVYEFRDQPCRPTNSTDHSSSSFSTANLQLTKSSNLGTHLDALFGCSRKAPIEDIESKPSSLCEDFDGISEISLLEIDINNEASLQKTKDDDISISHISAPLKHLADDESNETKTEIQDCSVQVKEVSSSANHGDVTEEHNLKAKYDDEIEMTVSKLLSGMINAICSDEEKTALEVKISIEVHTLMSEILNKVVMIP